MGTPIEHSNTALVKFNLGQLPGRLPLPPGHVVVAVDGMERDGFENEAFKAEKSAFLEVNPPVPGTNLTFVPVSSHYGDMILRRGDCVPRENQCLRENLEEIQRACQDALDDAVLMGCEEKQFRQKS